MTTTRYAVEFVVGHRGPAPNTTEVDRALADHLLGMTAAETYGRPDPRFVDLDPCSALAPATVEEEDAPRPGVDVLVAEVIEKRLAEHDVTLAEAVEALAAHRRNVIGPRLPAVLRVVEEILRSALPEEAVTEPAEAPE